MGKKVENEVFRLIEERGKLIITLELTPELVRLWTSIVDGDLNITELAQKLNKNWKTVRKWLLETGLAVPTRRSRRGRERYVKRWALLSQYFLDIARYCHQIELQYFKQLLEEEGEAIEEVASTPS
ncbi:MAG: hypothetical protein DRJ38_04020 [Thermoprotei archaeon]|nr:MAG: hypothetical protein DRJ38_04020 [Thermoprotei archaeon]